MTQRQLIRHKAGDTFRRSLAIDVAGVSAGMAVQATFVYGPHVINILSVVLSQDGALTCELNASAEVTADWRPALYTGDISFGSELTTLDSTETIAMLIERGY